MVVTDCILSRNVPKCELRRKILQVDKAEKIAKREKSLLMATSPSVKQTLTLEQALDLTIQQHAAERLLEAENHYQKILLTNPDKPVAMHQLWCKNTYVGRVSRLSLEYPLAKGNWTIK